MDNIKLNIAAFFACVPWAVVLEGASKTVLITALYVQLGALVFMVKFIGVVNGDSLRRLVRRFTRKPNEGTGIQEDIKKPIGKERCLK